MYASSFTDNLWLKKTLEGWGIGKKNFPKLKHQNNQWELVQ